jgi:hypothetical protein
MMTETNFEQVNTIQEDEESENSFFGIHLDEFLSEQDDEHEEENNDDFTEPNNRFFPNTTTFFFFTLMTVGRLNHSLIKFNFTIFKIF